MKRILCNTDNLKSHVFSLYGSQITFRVFSEYASILSENSQYESFDIFALTACFSRRYLIFFIISIFFSCAITRRRLPLTINTGPIIGTEVRDQFNQFTLYLLRMSKWYYFNLMGESTKPRTLKGQ